MSEITPYLCVADARAALTWYVDVLGAVVSLGPIEMPDGRIGHAELTREGATWMISDVFEGVNIAAPEPDRGSPVSLHLTVDDVDRVAAVVQESGVRLDRGPEDNPGLGRVAVFRDPLGHRWFLHQEESATP